MRGPKTSLTLVVITQTSDGMGSAGSASESTVATVTGVLRTLTGRERLASDMETVVRTHRFYIDYTSDLTDQRNKHFKNSSNQYFDIESVDNEFQKNIYMQVDLKEKK